MSRFTLKPVGWRPRIAPVQAETATPAQLAALEACPPAQRRSTYFLTLAHDPGSLGERGALFNIVMYAEGGLDRADRELATAVVSMVNGCVYCTSVHAKRFVELSGDEPAMQRSIERALVESLGNRDPEAEQRLVRIRAADAVDDGEVLGPNVLLVMNHELARPEVSVRSHRDLSAWRVAVDQPLHAGGRSMRAGPVAGQHRDLQPLLG